MILIGSRALAHYGLKRKCIDWDFLGSQIELDKFKSMASNIVETKHSTVLKIGDDIVEFSIATHFDKTLMMTYGNQTYCFRGMYYEIPDIEGLLAIKQATANHLNREKHFEDINWIHSEFPDIVMDQPLYDHKDWEIETRVKEAKANKHEFFHKYHDVEKLEHDKLHDMIAEMFFDGYPAYKWFVTTDTTPSKEAWVKMSETMKLRRFIEETIVLTLERWYIPKLLKRGVYNPYTKKAFPKMIQTLGEHVIRGLRDEAPFLSEWGKANKELVLNALKPYGKKLVSQDFQKWFYDELLEKRLNGKDTKTEEN